MTTTSGKPVIKPLYAFQLLLVDRVKAYGASDPLVRNVGGIQVM